MDNLLENSAGLVFGFANKYSIAYAITRSLLESNAKVFMTYQNERIEKNVKKLKLEGPLKENLFTGQCDINIDDEIGAVFKNTFDKFGKIDFIVHSIAFAPINTFTEPVYNVSRDDFMKAIDISSYSLISLIRHAIPYIKDGCSILTLSYLGAEKIIPGYNLMGIAKSTLESIVRYLANDLGRYNIRINALSPGPVETLSSSTIPHFDKITSHFKNKGLFKRKLETDEIGDVAKFLLSKLSRGITGETIYVDHGFNKVGV